MSNKNEILYHPFADTFPLMHGKEYQDFVNDVAQNGLLHPIVLHPDGSILDGRNRHRACLDTNTEPRYEVYSGSLEEIDLIRYVFSCNVHRRHLTSGQIAAILVLDYSHLLAQLQVDARGRQSPGHNQYTSSVEKFPPTETGKSRDQAAEIMGTNGRYIQNSIRLKENDAADLLQDVKIGLLSLPHAMRKFTKRQRRESPPLPTDGKYRVIYADPPWQYGNSGVIGPDDNYGHVERHYPDMSIQELCELPVKNLTEDNAVLFVWVTSPLLEDVFKVIKAWGFEYKTSFVWDKVGHNFGHYNSVRHEFLLICTRGSCTPDNLKLFDSVQSIKKSPTHSEKPEQFREIIDTLYTHGNRLELFARDAADGWEVWGNEV